MPVGIEALNAYCGVACVPVEAFFAARGLDTARLANLMMHARSIALPFEDPVTNAVNAARPIVDRLDPDMRARIEVLITCSESGIDYSKSIASYVHAHLGLSRRCRILEAKQACYSATGVLQLAAGYLAAGLSPGAKALVVATDVALVDDRAEYAEPTMGTGAAALLLSDEPRVMALDLGAFGTHSYETMDSARPGPTFDIADIDRSVFAYLDCLESSFADYADRVEGADFAETFDYLALHTPFAGLVKAAHRRTMRQLCAAEPERIEADFAQRVQPSLVYPSMVGNLCAGSLYLALASIVDTAPLAAPARVGLFSYGSGCASEFFSGVVNAGSKATLAEMRIGERLRARHELGFDAYQAMLAENLRCLVPDQDRRIEIDRFDHVLADASGHGPLLALTRIEGYHRKYDWLRP